MVGLDLSQAQLARARTRVPYAAFIHGDMARVSFPKASFDLVTNFWAGYCYLGSQERIAAVLRKAVRWIRTGGALYMEVLLARDLESFNCSHFAGQTGFAVKPRSEDYTEWRYDDVGGRHQMTSPPLEFFLDLLAPEFGTIEARHDSAFMVHLVATGRKPNP
jgi:ubiquinone/menaquinone biosynthesis C-methylase UbiE